MSQSTRSQERLFRFLSEKFVSQEPFTLADLKLASSYRTSSFDTYHSKQFGTLLVALPGGKVRVSLAFRRFNTWQKFRDEVVSQNRKLIRTYEAVGCQRVMSFEFFMPLRNEEWLRESLDSLFFREQVLLRLRAIKLSALQGNFPQSGGELEEAYFDRICTWISNTFGGYSISHVNGRFKVGELTTREQVAKAIAAGNGRYLVDETTAIVRFLFPCGSTAQPEEQSEKQANQIRWFFNKLFVETILEVVNGEDEVWLLESGFRSQLQRFVAKE